MPVAITTPGYRYCHKLNHRLSASISALSTAKKPMVTTASSSGTTSNVGAFTTIKETVTFEKEIKKSKFIAIAGPISNEQSAHSFLNQVKDPRTTHNCWAYKVGDQYRSNDDGEPSGTAGKPIHSAIVSSGLDRIMVVVIRYIYLLLTYIAMIKIEGTNNMNLQINFRYFGGIKLGTGGLVRAYGGVASECLRNAPTCLVKSKVPMGVEVPFDLLGVLYHQLQSFEAEDIKQDYDTGKDGTTMVSFKVEFDRAEKLEEAIKANCSRELVFYKH
ncbi:IMPACT family member in pol 5'region [Gossypium australe]|uniref:IMPACT family member in pol 5'region n=1 Tax=Gossypium australe TaxID=47621 RepID=A0A5B6VX25_9ROSI|nr:IMPACT family member in pol 5'region [Gossypium australe]